MIVSKYAMTSTEPFEAIAQFVGSHDSFVALSNDAKLDFYALYKSSNGIAPSLSFPRRLYLYCFEQVEYQKWLRWWLWSHQETASSAKERYCRLAQDIGAYPSPAELQIMKNASSRGKGASIMITEETESKSTTPELDGLIEACQQSRLAYIDAYVQSGGDVNVKTEEGTSLLHFAVDANDLDIVRLLIKYSVDVHVKDDEGLTPLKSAQLNGDEYSDMVELLSEYTQE